MDLETRRPSSVEHRTDRESKNLTRRGLVWGMSAALVAAYGLLTVFFARFVYPARPAPKRWLYVSQLSDLAPGDALLFETPSGETVNVTRQGVDDSSIRALSSTCPHLGCQVHWEPQNDRFFCPCHNGVFDPAGVATAGPPADAGQSLLTYPVKAQGEMLFIEVPLDPLARSASDFDRQREAASPTLSCRRPSPAIGVASVEPRSHGIERGRSS